MEWVIENFGSICYKSTLENMRINVNMMFLLEILHATGFVF